MDKKIAVLCSVVLVAACSGSGGATGATTRAPAVLPTASAEASEAVKPTEAPPKPEVSREPSASDGWAVADLSAFEAAFESGDYDQVRALFTDDGIMTTAWNTIGLYYGDTAEAGTWDVNAEGFRHLATAHAGEDMTVLGTPIQIGDNTVAFGWKWSSGVSGTALLHLRDGKIVVAIFNPSQAPIPWMRPS